jgi:hypothetical protein
MKVYSNIKESYILLKGKNMNGWKAGEEFDVVLEEGKIILKKREVVNVNTD